MPHGPGHSGSSKLVRQNTRGQEGSYSSIAEEAAEKERWRWNQTPHQKARMLKVEQYMNYEMGDGGSLERSGKCLLNRADQLKKNGGERLPK